VENLNDALSEVPAYRDTIGPSKRENDIGTDDEDGSEITIEQKGDSPFEKAIAHLPEELRHLIEEEVKEKYSWGYQQAVDDASTNKED
jgi:hypothetical protein